MYRVVIPETENPQEAKSVRVSLRGKLRLIRVDTLRRVHNVGILAGRLISVLVYESRLLQICCMNKNYNSELKN